MLILENNFQSIVNLKFVFVNLNLKNVYVPLGHGLA